MPSDYFAELQSTMDPIEDIRRFLQPRRPDTWQHVQAVADSAVRLAARFAASLLAAQIAAYAHDLAAVVPKAELLDVATAWSVPLSEADREIPQVVHGPLAAAVVRARLGIRDKALLDAIRYHSTLRRGASVLEKIVFVADKLAFDPTTPHIDYLPALQAALERSLDAAAFAYLDFVVTNRVRLGWKLHPHLLEAHRELAQAAR